MSIKLVRTAAFLTALTAASCLAAACNRLPVQQAESGAARVAKVDTDYVYEVNVAKYIADYKASRRARISNFVGFSPDDILQAREDAIDNEVREQIKRLPGVEITLSETTEVAESNAEALAWQLYEQITQEGADFATLAREHSSGLSARLGGVMDPFPVLENPEPYQRLAYGMEVGEVSEPLEGWDGWRIVRLDSVSDDPILGKQYHVSMIHVSPDMQAAEAEIIDRYASEHTIEVLDPKYRARQALVRGDFAGALREADGALSANPRDELAHYLKARALWGLGQQEEALAELDTAAQNARVSDGFAPYYYFYKGEYLEELGRTDEALAAYRQAFDVWHQDVTIAFDLLEKFKELGDDDYASQVQNEIDIIAQQDAVVLTFASRQPGTGGVIMTGEGQVVGGSAEYEPGYDR